MTPARARRTGFGIAATAATALAVVHAAPALSACRPLRTRAMPRLAGIGEPHRVALTFDDGPDPLSTPRFLDLLQDRGVHATFFVLGSRAAAAPALVREIADAGHEIAVHGWTHRPLPLRGPRATYEDLTRAIGTIADLAGQAPRLFRPPYGVMSAAAHLACRRLGLTPVLWTAWGRDWSCHAAPGQVHDTVMSDLHGDGTILLHDSDCTSAPASWRSALGALPALLDTCQVQGWKVGPLRDHGIRPYAPTR